MTCRFARNFQALDFVRRFVAIIATVLTMMCVAQASDGVQPSESTNKVLTPAQVIAPNPEVSPQQQPWWSSPVTKLGAKNSLPREGSGKTSQDSGRSLFLPVEGYATSGPGSVVIGDVNGDGKPDLVLLETPYAEVRLGNGDGTFRDGATYLNWGTTSVTLADVNGDGKLDMLIGLCGQGGTCGSGIDGGVGVLLGNGDGTFKPAVNYDSGGSEALSVAVADVNGDGKPDLVVSNSYFSDTVGVLFGNGDGTFQPVVTYSSGGSFPVSVAIADVNGDGKPDILVANSSSCDTCTDDGVVGVLLNNGDGTFQPAVTYSSGGTGRNLNNTGPSLVVADLNDDGKLDVAVTAVSSIGVLLGNGDGTFKPAVNYTLGGDEVALATGDVDGDGKPDLIEANLDLNNVGVLLGNGDGTFQAAMTFDYGGAFTLGLAFEDVNGDGRRDVVVTNYGGAGSFVSVLLNATGGTKPTTTTTTSTPNPSNYLQPVTLTANVTATSGKPKGVVIFRDGQTALGSASLVDGNASFSLTSLSPGTRSITALYEGSGAFEPGASAIVTQSVGTAITTTAVTSSRNPVPIGARLTYTATVTTPYPGGTSGLMTFQDNGVTVATGGYSYRTSYATTGIHSIIAIFTGDANNAGSTSPPLTQGVAGRSQTVVTTSGSPSHVGQTVTFTAMVTSVYGAIPDGDSVTFYDGSNAIGAGVTRGGAAIFSTSSLTAKTHVIKAVYSGDLTFEPSSGKIKQVVDK
jgi:hypothetical protein